MDNTAKNMLEHLKYRPAEMCSNCKHASRVPVSKQLTCGATGLPVRALHVCDYYRKKV